MSNTGKTLNIILAAAAVGTILTAGELYAQNQSPARKVEVHNEKRTSIDVKVWPFVNFNIYTESIKDSTGNCDTCPPVPSTVKAQQKKTYHRKKSTGNEENKLMQGKIDSLGNYIKATKDELQNEIDGANSSSENRDMMLKGRLENDEGDIQSVDKRVRDIENAHIRKALDTLDRPKSHYGISLGAGIIYNIDDPALAKFGYLVGLGYYGDISEKLGLDVQLNVGWFPKKITSRSELVISPPYGSNYDANTDTTSRVVAQLVAMVTTPLGNGFYAGIGPTLNFRHTNNKNSHTIYQTQFDDFGNICPPTEENGYTTYSQHDEDIFRLGIAGELGKGPVAIVGGYSPDNAWVQIKARIGLK